MSFWKGRAPLDPNFKPVPVTAATNRTWESLRAEALEGLKPAALTTYAASLARFEKAWGAAGRPRTIDQLPDAATLVRWTGQDVQRVITKLSAAGHGPKTIRMTVEALVRLFRPLVRAGHVQAFPWTGVQLPKLNERSAEHNVVPREQLDALLKSIPRSGWGLRDYAVVLTLVRLGWRASEFSQMTNANLTVEGTPPRTIARFRGKGGKETKMAVRTELLEAAEAWRAWVNAQQPKKYQGLIYAPGSPWIVGAVKLRGTSAYQEHGGPYFEPFSRKGVSAMVVRYTKALGLKGVSAHGLRATAISNWIDKLGIYAASKLARHSDLKLTQRYARYEILDEEDALRHRNEE